MRRLLSVLLLLLLPAPAWAQPSSQVTSRNEVTLQPAEKDTVGCRWERTMVSATATVALVGVPAQADATPAGIITSGPTAGGNLVVVQLAPDTGCSTAGCRKGNNYQVTIKGTDSNANTPICDILVKVRKVTF